MLKINRWLQGLLVFFTLPFLNIYYIENIGFPLIIWKLVPVLFLGIIFPRIKFDKFTILFTIFISVTLFTSLIGGYINIFIIFQFISFYAFITILHIFLKKDAKGTFEILNLIFTVIILMNGISILIGGLGIYEHTNAVEFLLGRENNIIRIVFPGIIIIYLYITLYNRNKVICSISVFAVIVGLYSLYYLGSTTAVVISILFLVVIFLKRILPNFWKMFMGYLIILVLVIWGQSFVFMSTLVIEILGNNLTYSGRMGIWIYISDTIRENILFGIGYGNTLVRDAFFPLSEEHNMLLQILMNSGLIGLFVFFVIILSLSKNLSFHYGYTLKKIQVKNIISFSIIAFLMIGIMESRIYDVWFWVLIMLGFNINYLFIKSK